MVRAEVFNLFNVQIPEINFNGDFSEKGMESIINVIYKRLIWYCKYGDII